MALSIAVLGTHFAWSASHHPQVFLNQVSGKKDEGAQIVNHYCASCHAVKPIIPLGAPRIGIVSDWQSRIKPGIKVILKHTEEGINAMPPRGGCFECSDDQLILAIIEMIPESLRAHISPK